MLPGAASPSQDDDGHGRLPHPLWSSPRALAGSRIEGEDVFAAEWGVGQVVWSIVWFTLFFIWIWLAVAMFVDIFRSRDLGGLSKLLWVAAVILFPYLGVFGYLIVRGREMGERMVGGGPNVDPAQRAFIRETGGTVAGPSTELARLIDLRAAGDIDQGEFERLKAQVVVGA
jgi:hypothetical protein